MQLKSAIIQTFGGTTLIVIMQEKHTKIKKFKIREVKPKTLFGFRNGDCLKDRINENIRILNAENRVIYLKAYCHFSCYIYNAKYNLT
jgi:hypothetical protein